MSRSAATATTPGGLFVVATPIGNLGDLSPRAAATLETAGLIVCEDTRVTRRLYSHLGVAFPPAIVANAHSERATTERVLGALAQGTTVAVVSDAGTPVVSDPGGHLIAAARGAGYTVTVIPGPSAVIAALAVAGVECGRFVFEGFLPRKGSDRSERLAALAHDDRAVVLFESPRRVAATLNDIARVFGADRPVAVCRELTKVHEQVVRGTAADLTTEIGETIPERGEFVLVIGGNTTATTWTDDAVAQRIRLELDAGASPRDAARLAAAASGRSRREVYALVLAEREADEG